MERRSLRARLGLVFLGFLLLVVASVAATFWLAQTQQADATVINLAGRQRMLAQQIVRLALVNPDDPELAESIRRFEQTQSALTDGGVAVDGAGRAVTLPAANSAMRPRLDEAAAQWAGFQSHLRPPINATLLQAEAVPLLAQLDMVVSAFEAQAQAKLNRLRLAQLIFLAAAFLLLVWGYRIVRRNLLQPLDALDAAAREIGAGRLDQAVPALPGNELDRLGRTMEKMRAEIAAYQDSLERRVNRRTSELTAAFEFSQEIVRQLEPAHLLQAAAQRARDLMQGEAASVCVLEDDGHTLELLASSGAGDAHLGLRQSTERGIALPVVRQNRTIVAEGGCDNCGFLRHFPGRFCIAAPLQIGGRALGALCVARAERSFDDEESRALTLLANAAAIALENARLIAAGQRQAEEYAALAEREKLAAELHDNLAQTLGAINLRAGMTAEYIKSGEDDLALSRLKEMQQNVKKAYTQARIALTGLREPLPDETELAAELQSCLDEFQEQAGVPAALTIADPDALKLSPVAQKQVVYIAREALTNARRHAQAGRVTVTVDRADGCAQLVVADDGCGFEYDRVDANHHLGLAIMRARAERSGGDFMVRSAPGEGTQIMATFPLEKSA